MNDAFEIYRSTIKSVLDKLSDALLVVTPLGKIIVANLKARQLLKPAGTDLFEQCLSIVTEQSLPQIQQQLKLCNRSRTPIPVSLNLTIPDCYIVNGFLYSPATAEHSSLIVLRIGNQTSSYCHFFALNEQLAEQKHALRMLTMSREELKLS